MLLVNSFGGPGILNAASSCSSPSFSGVTSSSVLPVAGPVLMEDFNGDGIRDLVSSQLPSTPIFLSATSFNIDSLNGGSILAVGDFNGDGKVDLVGSGDGTNLLIFLGKGDGTFFPPTTIAITPPNSPGSLLSYGIAYVATGDFNGDGKTDLAVVWSGSGYHIAPLASSTLDILIGNGDGTFQAPIQSILGPVWSRALLVGDINGDGKPDLVIDLYNPIDGSNYIFVYPGNGDGTFQAPTYFPSSVDMAPLELRDLNGDKKADLVLVGGQNSISIRLGNGDGTFQTPVDYAVGGGPSFVLAQDLNGDGKLDLAVANSQYNTVSILIGNGNGTFQAATSYPVGRSPQFIVAGDLNGDGKTDLAVANSSFDVSILLGSGNGTFQSSVSYAVTGYALRQIALADFNGDGKTDIAVATSGGNIAILYGNGDGTFRAVRNYPANVAPQVIAAADFNRDGKLDLAIANHYQNRISILLGTGVGTFQPPASYAAGNSPASLVVGDFNRDGNPDIAVANDTDNTVSILLGNGDGTFQPPVNYAVGSSPQAVALGDFNGDGKIDVVVANNGSDNISVLLGNGNGTFQPAQNQGVGPKPYALAVGDFNGDGKNDVAVATVRPLSPPFNNQPIGYVDILLGNGNGSFTASGSYSITPIGYSFPSSIAVADFNGDGKLDLVLTEFGSSGDGAAWVLLGNGNGTFQQPVRFGAGSGSTAVAVGDFNGDGKIDLAVGNSPGGPPHTVSILLGNGDGTFNSALDYGVGWGPRSVAVGDFNGDGKPDLAVANISSENVSILLNIYTSTCPSISLLPSTLPNASVGTVYNQTITASGGTAPYNFAITSGSLPPGIAILYSGPSTVALTGTPTTSGSYSFTITATDSNTCPGSRAYVLNTIVSTGTADVSISKSVSTNLAQPGSKLTYTLAVSNSGPNSANNLTLSDAIPTGTTFQSLATPAGWSCNTPSVNTTSNVSCSKSSLPMGGLDTFSLVVLVNSPLADGTVINNTATVSSSSADPNSANNTASAVSTVSSQPSTKAVVLYGAQLIFGCQGFCTPFGSPSWISIITMTNRTRNQRQITFDWLDSSGNLIPLTVTASNGTQTTASGGSITIAALDSITYTLSSSAAVKTGWTRYSTMETWSSKLGRYLPDIEVQVVFQLLDTSYKVLASVGYPVIEADTGFMGQALIKGTTDTGLAIANPNATAVTVNITLYNHYALAIGLPYATTAFTLAPGQQSAVLLSQLFPALTNDLVGNKLTDGNMDISASGPIAVTLFRSDGGNVYSGIPVYAGRQ
jgi:uncharacterized repeat protein (TIGR01451 family)